MIEVIESILKGIKYGHENGWVWLIPAILFFLFIAFLRFIHDDQHKKPIEEALVKNRYAQIIGGAIGCLIAILIPIFVIFKNLLNK